ncbi:unnamed protein product [Caenorhabditis angaria]|uniref:LEM domain-containing protein n=1 Tax=Caenorhabditis angaria TaxID=860376 RepID=B6VBV3_9PELO|nr:hypothetical protein Csp3_JD03.005 [Caenorhabditis angaria]CAI5438683.1 unnamed protein product [Caenorhabditis angaria]
MSDAAEISQLSDAALKEALLANGITPGPITTTTRSVYEKKLNKTLNETSLLDKSSTDSVVTAPTSVSTPKTNIDVIESRKSPTPIQVFPKSSNNEENGDASDAEDYEGEESMRYLTEEEMNADRQKFTQTAKKGGLKKWFIVSTAVAAIGVFSYFLLENAESLLLASLSSSSSSSSNDNTI